ncbi:DUF1491 family protein [Tianweitania sediminis]|uniref:DUF1491 family protein n=1 Tax=Tianweitania sediminis TaxID=1502156 RepID=A0A8J7UJK1_9HYPH|nr:DUF1491 family protein [Tianweitania sediminis]MBP0438885.1 DUF1491 family protein [Tianweitania sediminis]
MRLTSDFFVAALTRRVFGDGGFAAVVRRGATEAGAIFVTSRNRFGEVTLYGPAAQTSYGEDCPAERQFSRLLDGADDASVEARLAKEMRFDPDIWIVDVEPGRLAVDELLSVDEP